MIWDRINLLNKDRALSTMQNGLVSRVQETAWSTNCSWLLGRAPCFVQEVTDVAPVFRGRWLHPIRWLFYCLVTEILRQRGLDADSMKIS
jgi:hypothetical protein